MNRLTITAEGERDLVLRRRFAAPPALVFAGWTKPELVRRWLLGPDGWTMPVCEIDLRVGGGYRYSWRNAAGDEFGMQGSYREIAAPGLIVATETFEPAWYPGDAEIRLELAADGAGTLMTERARYASAEARDIVVRSPMESGAAASYDRLETLLAEAPAG
jgi:uncharacterized protein YndB with AHSA1/START domain